MNLIEPVVVDKIGDIEVAFLFEPDLPFGGKSVVGVVLVVFVAITILPDNLSVLLLILEYLPDVFQIVCNLVVEEFLDHLDFKTFC